MSYNKVRRLSDQSGASHVEFVPPVPYVQLPGEIAAADLCLGGPFGDTPKAQRIIPGKTFQFLAMARPTVVADNEATKEILAHGEQAWLVPMGDAEALASAVEVLAEDAALRAHLAAGGRQLFEERLSTACLAEQVATVIEEALCTPCS